MGWADLLILRQIPYDSDVALSLAHTAMKFRQQKSFEASALLTKERGNFSNWNNSIFYPAQPMRNVTRLSIAPTGTISLIADTSSSIESLFALANERKNILDGATLLERNQNFLEYTREYDLYTPQLVEEGKQ